MELHLRARIQRRLTAPRVRRIVWFVLRMLPVLRVRDHVIVTRHADVALVLERHREFSVRKYGSRMRNAGADFLLGHDEDPVRFELRERALRALAAARPERIAELSRTLSKQAIERAAGGSNHLDVIEGLVEEVPIRVVETFFGVPNPGGRTLLEWNQLISWSIFNPFAGPEDHERARVAGSQFRQHLADLVQRAGQETGPPSVLAELVRILREDGIEAWDRKAEETISGLVAGTLGPGPGLMCNALEQLLDLRGLQRRRLHDAARTRATDTIEAHLLEAGRMLPSPPMLFRAVEEPTTLMGKPIEPGLTMLCVIESALRDRRVISAPGRFRPKRWDRAAGKPDPMLFGTGLHWCIGRDIGMSMLTGMAEALFALPGLRRASGRAGRMRYGSLGSFPAQNFPRHLLVRFDRPL